MAAEPTAGGESTPPPDPAEDLSDVVGSDLDESEFWNEADRSRHTDRPPKTGRWRRKTRRPAAPSKPIRRSSLRSRAAAAWAAEITAMRALRTRPAGGGPSAPNRRRRKIAAGVIGAAALLAVAVAVADVATRGDNSDQAAAGANTELGTGGSSSAEDLGTADGEGRTSVESKIIDAPRPRTATRPTPTTTTTAAPATTLATTPAASPSGGPAEGSPAPAVPATAVPTTAPRPAPPTTVPTTAPKPPAKPTVQKFTAATASAPGGACSPTQWATTFTWATSGATSVAISGLLETTVSGLAGDGTKTVCRILPTTPLGGWTLTATGAGGSTTANS